MKQNELAALVGCTSSSLSQIECGLLRPSLALAQALDTVLHADGLLLSLFRDALDEQDRKTSARLGRQYEPVGDVTCAPNPADLILAEGDLSVWVDDVTIPDGTLMAPGERFTKIWRIRNGGSVAWKDRYIKRLGPLSAAGQITTPRLTAIPDTSPGELCDIAVHCKAHVLPGSSQAHFKISDGHGNLYYPDTNPEGIVLAITVVEGLTPRPQGLAPR